MKIYTITSVSALSLLSLFALTESYTYEDRIIPKEEYERLGPFPCPGLYCGRTLINDSYYTNCGKCDRGWRVGNNTHSICEECLGTPNKNDWFFLAFHVIFVLVLHWVAIDFSARRRSFTKEVLLLHTCAFFEVSVAAVVTGRKILYSITAVLYYYFGNILQYIMIIFSSFVYSSACYGAIW